MVVEVHGNWFCPPPSPAAVVAAASGLLSAIGLVAIHLLPRWSAFLSDPYARAPNLDWLSWAILYLQLLLALALVVTGGVARPESYELVGPLAEASLSGLYLDIVLVGVDGIAVGAGLTVVAAVAALLRPGSAR